MLHRARDLALALLAATLLALLPGSCASSGPRDLPPEAVLEVRFVETDPALPTTGFPWQGVDLPLGAPHRFGLSEVGLATDGLGRPALHFEVRQRDRPALRQLTEGRVGRRMAVVVDGEVVSLAVLAAPLPGVGQVEGDFDLAAIEAMIAAMSGPVD